MTSLDFDPRRRLCLVSRRRIVLGGAAMLGVPLGGCGGGGAAVAAFAPFFPFSFQGVVDRRIVSVNFAPDAAATPTQGRFNPDNSSINVRNPNGTAFNSNFEGSFDQRDMKLTLTAAQAPLAAAYDGRFTEDDTVVLTPTAGGGAPITVRRNQNDSFLPTLTGDWVGQDASGLAWRLRLDTEPPDSDSEATVLLVGTELLGAAAAVPLSGYASIRYIELIFERAGGNVRLTGTLQPDPTPPPPGESQTTATITFSSGGSLRRAV